MLESLATYLEELWRNVRIADAFDILLIASLLYCGLLWFGEAASRRVLVGATILALIYLAARMFDMHLTSLVFQAGLTVLLILLVVLFQEDLRRMLTRAATWLSLSQKKDATGDLETIAEAAFSLAQRKIGALLVLPGREPLGRHLSGGVQLDGRISPQLLDSIFDPSSDGHDGAAIVEEDRIGSFGVHLPISTNLRAIQGHGTRHSAALGLSECSDAIVVVVSEERGRVSIAQLGQLSSVESPAELLKQLQDTIPTAGNGSERPPWTHLITVHWRMKMLALSLATVAWFVLAYDPATVSRTYDVPIVYRNLPEGLVLDRPISQAQLTLSGSEASFRFVSEETLKISVDLAERPQGSHSVKLGPDNIQLPANLEIDGIEPGDLWLYLEPQPPKANDNSASP